MGNRISTQEYSFHKQFQILNEGATENGYYRLQGIEDRHPYIGRQLQSNDQDEVFELECIIDEKAKNPSPFVNKLINHKYVSEESFCSTTDRFFLLFRSPAQRLSQQIKDRTQVNKPFHPQEIDQVVTRVGKGLKYLYDLNHYHGQVSTDAITWPIQPNENIELMDEWSLDLDNHDRKVKFYRPKEKEDVEHKNLQLATDLYDLGIVAEQMQKVSNYRAHANNPALGPLNKALNQKIQILKSPSPKDRMAIFPLFDHMNQGIDSRIHNNEPHQGIIMRSNPQDTFQRNQPTTPVAQIYGKGPSSYSPQPQTLQTHFQDRRNPIEFTNSHYHPSQPSTHNQARIPNSNVRFQNQGRQQHQINHLPQNPPSSSNQAPPLSTVLPNSSHHTQYQTTFTSTFRSDSQSQYRPSNTYSGNQDDSSLFTPSDFFTKLNTPHREYEYLHVKPLVGQSIKESEHAAKNNEEKELKQTNNSSAINNSLNTTTKQESLGANPTIITHQVQRENTQKNIKSTPARKPGNHPYSTIPEVSERSQSVMSEDDREHVIEQYENGSRYEGYKKNGMRNGWGKFYYQEGSFYDGEWKNNNMHGYGKLYYSNGKLAYEGDWFIDQFHGKGKVYNDAPISISGNFDYTNFDQLQEKWQYYEGTLVSDSKEGQGKLVLSNGQYYEGQFLGDKLDGEGKFVRKDGQVIHGVWKSNQLVQTF